MFWHSTSLFGPYYNYQHEGLTCLLLQVHGVIRRSSSFNTGRINHLYGNSATHSGGCEYLTAHSDMCLGGYSLLEDTARDYQ